MALVGTEVLDPRLVLDKWSLDDVSDEFTEHVTIEYHYFDGHTPVLGQWEGPVNKGIAPSDIVDGIVTTLNGIVEGALDGP